MRFYLLLIFTIFNSCVTQKNIIKTEIKEIRFGSGGGFTGEVKEYKLTSDTRLFEKENELEKVDLKIALEFFKQAEQLKDYTFYEPGNVYAFITIRTNEQTNRIVWPLGSVKVNKSMIEFHKELMALVK